MTSFSSGMSGGRAPPPRADHVVRHDRLRDDAGVVPVVPGEVLFRRLRVVRQEQVADVLRPCGERLRVRVDEELAPVEPHPACRVERPLHLVAVELPRLHPVDEDVPEMLRPVLDPDDVRRIPVLPVEQEEKDLRRVLGIEGEVDAFRSRRGAQGIIPPRCDLAGCRMPRASHLGPLAEDGFFCVPSGSFPGVRPFGWLGRTLRFRIGSDKAGGYCISEFRPPAISPCPPQVRTSRKKTVNEMTVCDERGYVTKGVLPPPPFPDRISQSVGLRSTTTRKRFIPEKA